MSSQLKFIKQKSIADCGPSCLSMIGVYYERNFSGIEIKNAANLTIDGVSILGISNAAEEFEFKSLNVDISFEKLVLFNQPRC